MRFSLLFALILAIVAVIFALQNPQPMEVNLLFFRTEGSTALVLILTLGLGIIVGLLSTIPGRLRARRKLNALQSEVSSSTSDGASASDGNEAASSNE